jgi:phospholipase C
MKLSFLYIVLSLLTPTFAAAIPPFKHIIVVVQENRTPDNLFQGLCTPPFGSANSCRSTARGTRYNIQTSNWLNRDSSTGVTQPEPIPLANRYDLDHTHPGFLEMCDKDSTGACQMDGSAKVACTPEDGTTSCPPQPQFRFVDNSTGILNPYLELATQYGWANYMFQTNQGSSFPAHQYLFGGTSAPTAEDYAEGIFVADAPNGKGQFHGCESEADVPFELIFPTGNESQSYYPCFEHQTIPDLLPPEVTWRYYTSNIGLWVAPEAIKHICQSAGPGTACTGPQWLNNVDMNSADVLKDINQCNLRALSWVIPTGQNSDHAGVNDGGGPAWVASIVNAIGNSSSCDDGGGYWKNTAVFITWDDWGGWYDHEPPKFLDTVQGDYERGFRVPLIVVSAFTPKHYINNRRLDFGSMLRFIEGNYGIPRGDLGFADAETKKGLHAFFNFDREPRRYKIIDAPKTARFFLNDKRPPLDPDDD